MWRVSDHATAHGATTASNQREVYRVKRNSTSRFVHERRGRVRVTSEGGGAQCHGEDEHLLCMPTNYGQAPSWSERIVALEQYVLEMWEEPVTLHEDGTLQVERFHLQLPCPVEKEGCTTREFGVFSWLKPTALESCQYYRTKTAVGKEITDSNGDTYFLSGKSMLRLRKGEPRSRCGGILYASDFNDLYLTPSEIANDVEAFQRPVLAAQVSLFIQMNQQDAYLYYAVLNKIKAAMKKARLDTCKKQEAIRRAQYAKRAAEQHAIASVGDVITPTPRALKARAFKQLPQEPAIKSVDRRRGYCIYSRALALRSIKKNQKKVSRYFPSKSSA